MHVVTGIKTFPASGKVQTHVFDESLLFKQRLCDYFSWLQKCPFVYAHGVVYSLLYSTL
jgi:hypothetical protein